MCCRSAVSVVAQVWSALFASSPYALYSVSWWPLSLFSLWIILLPPSPPPNFIFSLFSVTGAWFHWHGGSWLEDMGLPDMQGRASV